MTRAGGDWKTVLIVDDDRDTREMYSESLRAAGFSPLTAGDGEDALRVIIGVVPSVVVTDLRLKGTMDGLELTRRLRADDRTKQAHVIMLTGADSGNESALARESGCDRFLTKPCLPEALIAEIRRALGDAIAGPRQRARAQLDDTQASRDRRKA